jgi:hypothetical protein
MTKNEAILKSVAHWEKNVRLLKEHIGDSYTFGIQEHKIYFHLDFNQKLSFSSDDCALCTYATDNSGFTDCIKCPGFIANKSCCGGGSPWSKFKTIIETKPHIITQKHIDAAQEVLDWVAKAKELMEDAL